MLNKTLVINTIQKELRNKGVLFLFVFTLLFLYFGHRLAVTVKDFVDESSLNTFIANSSQSIIISFVSFCTNFIAIILAATIFRSDISTKILPQMLTFPVSRFTYLASRITGAWLLTLSFFFVSLILGIFILLSSGSIELDYIAIGASFVFMSFALFGTIFMCSFLSFYSNKIFTLIMSFVYLVIAKLSFYQIVVNPNPSAEFSVGKLIGLFVYYCTPRVGELSYVSEQYIGGKTFDLSQLAMVLIHFFAVIVIWSFIFKYVFERREV